MKSINYLHLILILFLSTYLNSNAQLAIVNIDTINYYGTTDTLDYMPIIINSNGNVVVSGNQKMSSTQYDATTADQTINAVNNWITSYNTSNQKAFITCNTHDSNGNIISAGAIRTPTSNGTDMLIICQASGGSILWVYVYDGVGNLNDIASSVCVDPNDNIYIAGASDSGFPTFMNYVTIKFSPSGTKLWETTYDYGNYFDIPTSIIYDNATNNVIVSGSSGTSYTDYDFATVIYDENSGTQISSNRTVSNGSGEDKVFGMVTDNFGNIYVAGTTYNGTNFDAQLVKLDTSLTTVYTRTLDFYGQDDVGINLTLDDSSNVILVGTTNVGATKREMFIAKYTNNGTFLWKKSMAADNSAISDAEAVKVIAKSHNELFVGCNFTAAGNQDLVLFRFNKYGMQTMEKRYNGPSNGKEQFMDMTLDNNKIFISARSFNGTNDDNIVLTISYRDMNPHVDSNNTTLGKFIKGDVIVRFNKSSLKMNKINDTKIEFGQLSDFVNDSTCDKIEDALDPDNSYRLNAKTLPVRKLMRNFKESDSLSYTRMDDYVKIPEVWASLIISLPSYLQTETSASILYQLKPEIAFAQTDQLFSYHWVPVDTYYSSGQTSLHPNTTYQNAHINMEPAWDYTKGLPFVKVGIFDSGIYHYGVNDFNNAILSEHDYVGSGVIDYEGHGTKVASVIGARSNNASGIAGIAGGNLGNGAVYLISMKINDYNFYAPTSAIKNAFMAGATGTNIATGLGMHIMNCSWGKVDTTLNYELIEGLDFVNQNGVAFIASRGNSGGTNTFTPTDPSQPAVLSPQKVMSVGASGTDGHYHKNGTNGSSFNSMHSRNMDFLAPGAAANITAIYAFDANPIVSQPATITYTNFGGTSASAPHVSGVVALMMSYKNSSNPSWHNIVHEDCEAILKRTATDLISTTYTESVGYDAVSGYGRINADSALSALEPQYKFRHIDLNHFSTSASTATSQIATNVIRYWPGSSVFPAGNYSVDVIEYTVSYNYNFSSETFIDAWPLHKASDGHPSPTSSNIFNENYYSELISANLTSATLKTWGYRFNNQLFPPYTNYGGMMTPSTNSLKAAFTLYTIGDPNTPVGITEPSKQLETDYFNVYPNPSNGSVRVGFSSRKETTANLFVLDISGRIVHEKYYLIVKNGVNRYDLDLSAIPKGIYFINLEIESNKALVKKVIIN